MEFDNAKDELLSVVETALKYAKSKDSEAEYEVFLYYEKQMTASIQQGIVTAKDGVVSGNAVRVAKGKQLGFACATGITDERVKRSVREALAIVENVSVEDDKFEGFSDPMKGGKDGVVSQDIISLGIDDLIKNCEILVKDSHAVDERIKVVTGNSSASWNAYAISNTRGVQTAAQGGINSCYSYSMSIVGDERKAGIGFDVARDRVFDPTGLGEKAGKEAIALHGAEKLDITATMPTVWAPLASASYVAASLMQAASGRPVTEGISPLCDRIGDKIASDQFSLIDGGTSPTGLGTYAVDHEGVPHMETKIIERGILKSFLFNTYYARVAGVETTGNCSRGGGVFGSGTPYESVPSIAAKELRIENGNKSVEDIISSIDERAVFIRDYPIGIFHSDLSTGEFSGVANAAFLIEDGEIKKPLQPVSVAGDFYDGFSNIIAVGDDVEITYLEIEAPTIAIDGLSITG